MSDIFISYASEDREKARALATALECRSWSVWWDREIPLGESFDNVIERAMSNARCVLVLWSAASAASEWVRSEASEGNRRGILVPVFLEEIEAPLAFRLLNGATLKDWEPGVQHHEFDRLINHIAELLGKGPAQEATLAEAQPVRGGTKLSLKGRQPLWIGASVAVSVLIALGVFLWPRPVPKPPPSLDAGSSTADQPSTSAGPTLDAAPATKGAFAISIGSTLSEGMPGPGAGMIESPGAEDVYRFSAVPNQRVYFRVLEFGKGMSYINWQLTGPDEQEVFDQCLGCGDPGVQTLTRGGSYALTVGNPKDPATGAYKLRLTNVPASDRFDIRPPSRISDGVPARGAGMIETPGASDVYVFSAAAGQRVYFRVLEFGKGMTYINWQLTGPDEQEVFDQCLGCGDPGVQTLTRGGSYVLTVGNPKDPATGAYRLELTTP